MLQNSKVYISTFLIALWALTQGLQVSHEVLHYMPSHRTVLHYGCSHHNHDRNHEVKAIDKSQDSFIAFEDCAVCEFEWFNSLESPVQEKFIQHAQNDVPQKLGEYSRAITDTNVLAATPLRGPPMMS